MQIEQLFEFVYVLIDKKKVKAKEMAERFAVSTRTIYRWVEALSISGIPVYSTLGRGGGISIEEKFAMDKTVLSEEDRLAIVSSVKALNSLGANIKTNEKISQLVSNDTDWLEVDFAPWSPEGSEVRTLFATLRDSILKKKILCFDYFKADGKMEQRSVHPWKLIFRGQAWYLLAWCTSRKEERFFKLSRIRNLRQTGRSANSRQELNGSTKSKKDDYVSTGKMPLIQIKATVSKEKIPFLLDAFVCSEIKLHKDESASVTFTAPDSPWLCENLLSFGPSLKIISPLKIKKQIVSLAEETLKLYDSHTGGSYGL
ncbi:MAG: YafY family protein [Treponema sp.]|nr:YafY family protein [Treponema sp.]